jgi:hypothetical protein
LCNLYFVDILYDELSVEEHLQLIGRVFIKERMVEFIKHELHLLIKIIKKVKNTSLTFERSVLSPTVIARVCDNNTPIDINSCETRRSIFMSLTEFVYYEEVHYLT